MDKLKPNDEPGKQKTAEHRIPLARLASHADSLTSGGLRRVVSQAGPDRGPAPVLVAAFQSAV
ncbi:hypothetical protein AQJ54_32380 [Streptomyces griseorubiginosus]|uniref:FXSXX-COOH protein n=1 Tax=Streptomyces griseorubiginosus TaxID=67304 RepID=A0A101RU83_9ACTN|nr:hypothetical protein AQJ54_32380 [Streptomyces griseorubiginosus]